MKTPSTDLTAPPSPPLPPAGPSSLIAYAAMGQHDGKRQFGKMRRQLHARRSCPYITILHSHFPTMARIKVHSSWLINSLRTPYPHRARCNSICRDIYVEESPKHVRTPSKTPGHYCFSKPLPSSRKLSSAALFTSLRQAMHQ